MRINSNIHNEYIKNMSGGEKVRICLIELLFNNYDLLILDEPSNHLDINISTILIEALINYKGSIILVTHDNEYIKKLNTKLYIIENKKIKEIEYNNYYKSIINNI